MRVIFTTPALLPMDFDGIDNFEVSTHPTNGLHYIRLFRNRLQDQDAWAGTYSFLPISLYVATSINSDTARN